MTNNDCKLLMKQKKKLHTQTHWKFIIQVNDMYKFGMNSTLSKKKKKTPDSFRTKYFICKSRCAEVPDRVGFQ